MSEPVCRYCGLPVSESEGRVDPYPPDPLVKNLAHYACARAEIHRAACERLTERGRLERAGPALLTACKRISEDVRRYLERGGTLTEREAESVRLLDDAIKLAEEG